MSTKSRAMAEKWVGQRPVFVLGYTAGFLAYAINAAAGLASGDVAPFHLQLLAWAAAAAAVFTISFGRGVTRLRNPEAHAIVNDELAASYSNAGMRWGFATLLAGSVAMLVATLWTGTTPVWMLVMVPSTGIAAATLRFAWSDHRSARSGPDDD
jgi:hypothetical protein